MANPLGFPQGGLRVFEGNCLFTCLALCRLYCSKQIYDLRDGKFAGKLGKQLKQYFDNPSAFKKKGIRYLMSNQAGMVVLNQVREMQRLFPSNSDPKDILRETSERWKVNIILYSDSSPPVIWAQFPSLIDMSLPIFPLLLTVNSQNIGHVTLIKNLRMFSLKKGFVCFQPQCKFRTRWYKNYNHFCRAAPSCNICNRYLQQRGTSYVADCVKDVFCDSSVKKEFSRKCRKCGLTITTIKCQIAHNRLCTKLGKICNLCNQFQAGDHASFESRHSCYAEPICLTCFQPKRVPHLCTFESVKKKTDIPNLAFISFQMAISAANCLECMRLEEEVGENLLCSDHESCDSSLTVISASLIFESEREKFSRRTFLDPRYKTPTKIEDNIFSFNYLPASSHERLRSLHLTKRLVKFGKPARVIDDSFQALIDGQKNKEFLNVAEKAMYELLSEKYRNYTILCQQTEDITICMTALLALKIIPVNVIRHRSKLIRFSIPHFDISFLSLKQFLSHGLADLKKQYVVKCDLSFFPKCSLGQKEEEATTMPAFENFISLTDDDHLLELKQIFWEDASRKPWNEKEALFAATSSQVETVALAALSFLRSAIGFQKDCLIFLGKRKDLMDDDATLAFTHPFSCTSLGAYVFETFRKHFLPDKTMYPIRRCDEFGRKKAISSRPEYLATEFLRFQEPKKWQTSHSSYLGQKKFVHMGKVVAIVDAYHKEKKIAYFFNG